MQQAVEIDPLGACLRSAWKLVQEDVADRACLVRVRNPAESMFVPTYHRALRTVREALDVSSRRWLETRMSVVVPALAKIRENDSRMTFAEQLAFSNGGNPVFSATRFRRLLQATNDADLHMQVGRAIAVLRRDANVVDLARSLIYWNQRGDRVRQTWAVAYFGATL